MKQFAIDFTKGMAFQSLLVVGFLTVVSGWTLLESIGACLACLAIGVVLGYLVALVVKRRKKK